MATWETGYGAVAVRVAPLAESIQPRQRLALAAELSGLSEALWRCYTHPASAADSLEVNTEGWRREQTRQEFPSVVGHIRQPNLPYDNGTLLVSYDPVEERAHRVEPDPERLDTFIAVQLSEKTRMKIVRAVK